MPDNVQNGSNGDGNISMDSTAVGENDLKVEEKEEATEEGKLECGVIMPISPIDGCSAEHWKEVLSIIKDVIKAANFKPNLVSDSEDVGIIHRRIINNIYNNPVIVCDVSGKNSNVMFELGMRLAFDKPTIIIKDDATDYSFDTSVIEHLEYPRDLRFHKIVGFKEKLREKIIATHKKAQDDPSFSTFLKHFGEYKLAHIAEKEVSSEKYLVRALDDFKSELRHYLRRHSDSNSVLGLNNLSAEFLIEDHVNSFMTKNDIEFKSEIIEHGLEEELYVYLESFISIRRACGSPDRLRKLMNDYLLKPT